MKKWEDLKKFVDKLIVNANCWTLIRVELNKIIG